MYCPHCNKDIQSSWRYCRFCGKSVEIHDDASEINEIKEEVSFDKDLYFKVLAVRGTRVLLEKERKTVKADIDSLLNQLKEGLVDRDYALPELKKLKEKVKEFKEEEDDYDDLPDELPIEVLISEISDADERIKKIEKLKKDPSVSKESVQDARTKAENTLAMLNAQYDLVIGHMRNWLSDIKSEIKQERKELEQLYIRFKTGELVEESYEEKKGTQAKKLTTMTSVEEIVAKMIK
jgi:chromosome segregation ATPase